MNWFNDLSKKIFSVISVAVLISLVAVSCADGGGGLNLFSLSDDAQLGAELDTEIRNNPAEYPILNNPNAEEYLQGIVDKIVQSPDVQFEDEFIYDVTIIDQDSVVNAFATPGGYIYVYTGLLKFMPNEAALAGVLGHEVAHAEERHATERMTTSYGLSALLSIVLGENPGQLETMAANLLGGLYLLKNSRSDELESDEMSFRYLDDTEYYPAAMEYFFEELGDGSTNFSIEQLLITHPDPDIRLEEIRKLASENNVSPTVDNLFTDRYQQFLSTLN